MPTVKYKCGETGKMKTKVFPYTAVGKAQAGEFASLHRGSVKTMKSTGY
tara:strand:+ start:468 stop:614 length:147 start_codon:yes stop_codon:yes gene_type:complete